MYESVFTIILLLKEVDIYDTDVHVTLHRVTWLVTFQSYIKGDTKGGAVLLTWKCSLLMTKQVAADQNWVF